MPGGAADSRRGEAVSIAEYAEAYPDLAPRILELFPTLLLVEQLSPGADSTAPSTPAQRPGAETLPPRLGDFTLFRAGAWP